MLNRLVFSYSMATYTLIKLIWTKKEFKEATFPELKKELENGLIDHLLLTAVDTFRLNNTSPNRFFPWSAWRCYP